MRSSRGERIARVFGRALVGALPALALAAGPIPDLDRSQGMAGFAQVLGPRAFDFPRDHGAHPDYRQEWWYVTGNLDGPHGERFGFELTFFRFALAPAGRLSIERGSRWRTHQIYMAHFAVTDVARKRFRYSQKLSRDALGLAGAVASTADGGSLRVWLDDWSLSTSLPAATQWRLHAVQPGYELTLDAQARLPPVLNGEAGLSRKSSEPGSASYYYSMPRVAVSGRLMRDGVPLEVSGVAWVDREWGSGTLGSAEQGWDWFALELKDGSSVMFYSMRNRDGSRDPHSAGTWVDATGQSRPLASDEVRIEVEDYWKNQRGERYPARWHVRIPTENVELDVQPVLQDQELTTSPRYWEGAVDVSGSHDGHDAAGRGYVELVGYAAQ